MIHTRQNHHEELAALPQIIGACYVAGSLAIGVVIGWMKGRNTKEDTRHEDTQENAND